MKSYAEYISEKINEVRSSVNKMNMQDKPVKYQDVYCTSEVVNSLTAVYDNAFDVLESDKHNYWRCAIKKVGNVLIENPYSEEKKFLFECKIDAGVGVEKTEIEILIENEKFIFETPYIFKYEKILKPSQHINIVIKNNGQSGKGINGDSRDIEFRLFNPVVSTVDDAQIDKLKKAELRANRNAKLFYLMNKWIKLKQMNIAFGKYFEQNNFTNVAIYGCSYVGETLYQEIFENINVLYAIDKKTSNKISEKIETISPQDIGRKECPDVIIVTAIFFFDEIYNDLKERTSARIVNLEDVIDYLLKWNE